jgi:hypothetical protein
LRDGGIVNDLALDMMCAVLCLMVLDSPARRNREVMAYVGAGWCARSTHGGAQHSGQSKSAAKPVPSRAGKTINAGKRLILHSLQQDCYDIGAIEQNAFARCEVLQARKLLNEILVSHPGRGSIARVWPDAMTIDVASILRAR